MALHNKRGKVLTAGVAALSLAALSACGGSGAAGGGDDDTFTIFAVGPVSGALAGPGSEYKAGLEAAVEVINDNGGIDGQQVELTFEDNAGDPTQATAKVQQALRGDDRPDLVIPGATSTEAVAVLPLLEQEGVLGAGTAVSTELDEFEGYITGPPRGVDASKATLKKIQDSGAKSVGMIYVDNVSGESAEADVKKHAKDFGLELTGSESVASDATDASAQLQRLKSKNPDALVWSGYSPSIAPVMKSRAKINWDVPTFADQTVGAFPYTALLSAEESADLRVVVPSYVVKGSKQSTTESMEMALEEIEEKYGKEFESPIQMAIHAYMSVILTKYAIEEAGSTDRDEVWEARQKLTPEDTPLYVGSSTLYDEDATTSAYFPPEDFAEVVAKDFEHGLFVPTN